MKGREQIDPEMDKSMLADLDSLPEADKIRMSNMIDQLQIRDRSCSSFHLLYCYSSASSDSVCAVGCPFIELPMLETVFLLLSWKTNAEKGAFLYWPLLSCQTLLGLIGPCSIY